MILPILLSGYGTDILKLIIILFIITLFLSSLFLLIITKFFKLKKQSYKTALFIVLTVFFVNLVFYIIRSFFKENEMLSYILKIIFWILISFLFAWWLIKKKYNISWRESFLIWLIWIISVFILDFVVDMILPFMLRIILMKYGFDIPPDILSNFV